MTMQLAAVWNSLQSSEIDLSGLDVKAVASVLIAITDSDSDPQIILTQRSETMSTHAGQVAFPGGRYEPEDLSLAATALRESEEEIGLAPHLVQIKGRLGEIPSINGTMVYPFVGIVPQELDLTPDPAETQAIFQVPLRFFLESPPERTDETERQGVKYSIPAWFHQGYEIWGLTAYFIDNLIDLMKKGRLDA